MPQHIVEDPDAPFSAEQRVYLSHEFHRLLHPFRRRFWIVLGLFMVINLVGFPLAAYKAETTRSQLLTKVCANQNAGKERQNHTIDVLEAIIRTSTLPRPGESARERAERKAYRDQQIKRLETVRPGSPTDCDVPG